MRTTFSERFDAKIRHNTLFLLFFAVGLFVGTKGLDRTAGGLNISLNSVVTNTILSPGLSFWESYTAVFGVYFAIEVILLMAGLSIYPMPVMVLFFMIYGTGIGFVINCIGNEKLFLYAVILPVYVVTVCCYILLAESVVLAAKKRVTTQNRPFITKETAVKLFCITAVLSLVSLYYCAVKPAIL